MNLLKTVFVVPAVHVEHAALVSAPVQRPLLAGVHSSAMTLELGPTCAPMMAHAVSLDSAQHWEDTANSATLAGQPTIAPSHVVAPVQFLDSLLFQLEVLFEPSPDVPFDFILHQLPSSSSSTMPPGTSGSKRRVLGTGEYNILDPALRPSILNLPLAPCGYPSAFQSASPTTKTATRAEVLSALAQWIVESYYERSQKTLSNTFGTFSDRLKFEFDSYLCAVGKGCASLRDVPLWDLERPLYLVRPLSSGTYRVIVELPLLVGEREILDMHCDVLIDMYLKVSRQQSLKSTPRLSLNWRYRLELEAGKGLFHVLHEHIAFSCKEVEKEETAATTAGQWSNFLLRALEMRVGSEEGKLPSYATYSSQRNATLMEFIPELETTLKQQLEEPQHFLELIHALSQYLGMPVQWNMIALPQSAVRDHTVRASFRAPQSPRARVGAAPSNSSSGTQRSLPKFASFLCMDRKTSMSFTLQVGYSGLRRAPDVVLQSTMHILSSNQRPLRVNVSLSESSLQFAEGAAGFNVGVMAEAVHRGVQSRFSDVQRVVSKQQETS